MREAGQPVFRHIGGEEVVGRSRQQVLLNKSPRRHDPHYLAVDQVAPFWGLHLLADRNLVAPRDQLAEMGIQGVVWYTCQRHALILAHRPRGERDLQLPRHRLRVLIERLVEVAETEKKYGVRIAALDV